MAKTYPLPKRFRVALSDKAYGQLRELNAKWHLGNNYLLVVLLEKLDSYADPEALDRAFGEFIEKFGSPSGETKTGV